MGLIYDSLQGKQFSKGHESMGTGGRWCERKTAARASAYALHSSLGDLVRVYNYASPSPRATDVSNASSGRIIAVCHVGTFGPGSLEPSRALPIAESGGGARRRRTDRLAELSPKERAQYR
jgi:hypothetical protein